MYAASVYVATEHMKLLSLDRQLQVMNSDSIGSEVEYDLDVEEVLMDGGRSDATALITSCDRASHHQPP